MPRKAGKQAAFLLVILLIIWGAVWLAGRSGVNVRARDYQQKLAAAQTMQRCMEQVRLYRERRGIPLSPLDIHKTGLIGVEFNGLTTTLGEIGAKRTTASTDMAALLVQMLREAGIQPGGRVGIGLSGSSPAMNLAVLSACDAMDIDVVCYASVGSSTYGANNPELSFPEMLLMLMQDGLLTSYPVTVTLGGGDDCGMGMDETLVAAVEERLDRLGSFIWREPDYAENLRCRMDDYGDIACYIGVGGNITSLGRDREIPCQGVIQPEIQMLPLSQNSGLVERYHAQGIPVIHLLNIKKLAEDYALPFDPTYSPIPGESAIYLETAYPRLPIAVSLLLVLAGLVKFRQWRKSP